MGKSRELYRVQINLLVPEFWTRCVNLLRQALDNLSHL